MAAATLSRCHGGCNAAIGCEYRGTSLCSAEEIRRIYRLIINVSNSTLAARLSVSPNRTLTHGLSILRCNMMTLSDLIVC